MRKMLFTALLALCAIFPGEVCANSAFSVNQSITVSASTDNIDPALLDRIFEAYAEANECSCNEARQQYEEGDLVIEKVMDGYVARSAEGNGIILVLGDEA